MISGPAFYESLLGNVGRVFFEPFRSIETDMFFNQDTGFVFNPY